MTEDLEKTSLWYMVQDTITPYVMAIDDVLSDSGFVQDTSYEVNEYRSISPPSGCIITSLKGYSESSNPDSGWFQVGEFYDDSGDKYFMLVNRACSMDDEGTCAPPATAIVELNRSVFDDSTRLYVIDIAHETEYDSINGWQAVPETTITYLYDSKLYYTTTLRAGEGRLFKIVDVPLDTAYLLTKSDIILY